MAVISKERTFTLEKIKKLNSSSFASVFLFLLVFLPFIIFKKAPPQSTFYNETMSIILVALFIFFYSVKNHEANSNKNLFLYLSAIAIYIFFDIFISKPIYPSLHLLYVGIITISALLSQMLLSNSEPVRKSQIIVVFTGLMIGALLQDVVILLQMLHQDWLYGWILYIDKGEPYSGNIGQRNLTAHYLSWGIFATCYLIYANKIKPFSGYTLIIIQALFLGFVNSRTLLLYIFTISGMLPVIYIWQKHLPKRLLKILLITLTFILLFQLISLPILSLIQHDGAMNSSVNRLSEVSGLTARTIEWHKAWLIFLENPFFGSGWNSYGYEGFIKSSDVRLDHIEQTGSFFSHSHNIIFNLLAELGILGTLFIVFGLLYLLSPLLKSSWTPETLTLFIMITVSTIHSLLEFPLWYAHFFLVFIILLTLLICSINNSNSFKLTSPSYRLSIMIVSVTYLIISAHLYTNYSQLDKLYYRLITDNIPEDKVITAQKMLEIGDKQPLIRTYADIKAIDYLRMVPSDKISHRFNQPLKRYAYYRPYPTAGIYYLITQCDNSGNWNSENWQYYDYLSHHYKEAIPSFSIIMSMTNNCRIVYEEVNQQCQDYKTHSINTVCSMAEVEDRVE